MITVVNTELMIATTTGIIMNNGNETFQTIEGNTNGSRADIRTRSAPVIRKIIYPNFDDKSTVVSTPAVTASLSILLKVCYNITIR